MKHLNGLNHPDKETADILSRYAPEDKNTMERIFRRAEEKYRTQTDSFAESVGGHTEDYKPRRLFAAVVSLAACAVMGVSGWGIWKLQQHQPPISPGESIGETSLYDHDTVFADSGIPFYPDSIGRRVEFVRSGQESITLRDEELAAFWDVLKTVNWEQCERVETAETWTSSAAAMQQCFMMLYEYDPPITGAATTYSSSFIFAEDKVMWYQFLNGSDEFRFCQYPITAETYWALYSIVFGAEEIPAYSPALELSISARDITRTGLKLYLQRHAETQTEILYGEAFSLEIYQNGKWQKCTPVLTNYGFTSEGYPLNESAETAVDWEWLYGELPDGHYRIVKDFYEHYESPGDVSHTLAAEFDITDAPATPHDELPFSIEAFRRDLVLGMTPAYAPSVFSVVPSLPDVADAMERTDWIESEANWQYDGERIQFYVHGGGEHYRLEFVPNTVFWSDGTETRAFRVSEDVWLAAKEAVSFLDTAADPAEYLIPYEPQGGNAIDEVWDVMENYA